MNFVDDTEEDPLCQGVPGKTCQEKRTHGAFCVDCDHENRILALEAKYKGFVDAGPAKRERRKKGEKKMQPAQQAEAQPTEATTPVTPVAPITCPPIVPVPVEAPPAPKQIIKCSAPGCWHTAEGTELCKGCYGIFKIWQRYTLEGKSMPIIISTEVLKRFEALAQQLDL